MRPVLFWITINGEARPVSSYLFFGVLAAVYLCGAVIRHVRKEKKKIKDNNEIESIEGFGKLTTPQLIAAIFISIAAYLIGARLLYALLYMPRIIEMPGRLVEMRLRNFSLHGGLLAVLALWWYFSRSWQLFLPSITDPLVPHAGVAVAIMRMGCFFNGCCFGKPTDLPWGMVFPLAENNPITRLVGINVMSALLGASVTLRHPTQLYEMAVALLASVAAAVVLHIDRKGHRMPGLATAVFGLVFSAGRLLVFFLRDFPSATEISNLIRGPVVYGLSLLIFSLWIWRIQQRRYI